MGSILRGVLGKRLVIIDKSATYSVLMHWIFLKHVLGGVNDRGHRLINYLYTSGVNLGPLGLDLLQRCISTHIAVHQPYYLVDN